MCSHPVHIYTDGSCSPNPGPGGWGAVLLFDGEKRIVELHGGVLQSTNNRMEITAAIEALASLSEASAVVIFTDSLYLRDGVNKWLPVWQKRAWQTMDGTGVKNRDLWERLGTLLARHQVQWHWVKGHDSSDWNKRADILALAARKSMGIQEGTVFTRKRRDETCGEKGVVAMYPAVTWKNSTGTGSWAVILHFAGHYRILGGYEKETTANRLYLQAIRMGLEAMKRPVAVHIFTKSGYIRDGLGQWLFWWQKNDWQTRTGGEVSNLDEWQKLFALGKIHALKVVFCDQHELPCHLQEAKEIAREFDGSV